MSMGNESSSELDSSSDNPNAEINDAADKTPTGTFDTNPKKAKQPPFDWFQRDDDLLFDSPHWAKMPSPDIPVRYVNRWYDLNLPDHPAFCENPSTWAEHWNVSVYGTAHAFPAILVRDKKNQIAFDAPLLNSVPCTGDFLVGCLKISGSWPSGPDNYPSTITFFAHFALKRPRSLKKVSQKRDTSPKRTIPGVGKLVKEPKPPKAPKTPKSKNSKSKKSKLGEPIALELPLGPEIPIETAIESAVDPAVDPAVEPAGITTTPLHQLQDDFLQILIDTFSEIKARYRRKAPENVRLPPGL